MSKNAARLLAAVVSLTACGTVASQQEGTNMTIASLLSYQGPSLALPAAPSQGVTLFGYFDSDDAARAVDRVLSAKGVPFYLERPKGHWQGVRARMSITVPDDRAADAQSLLAEAAEAGLIETAPGADGLVHY